VSILFQKGAVDHISCTFAHASVPNNIVEYCVSSAASEGSTGLIGIPYKRSFY
jgi:hypothetical protein